MPTVTIWRDLEMGLPKPLSETGRSPTMQVIASCQASSGQDFIGQVGRRPPRSAAG